MAKPPAAPLPPPAATGKPGAVAPKPEWSKPLTSKAAPPKSSGGGIVYAVLLASMGATGGLGYYIHENPNFNPTFLKDNEVFVKFREFVLSSFPSSKASLSSTVIVVPESPTRKQQVDKVEVTKKKTTDIKKAAASKQAVDAKKAELTKEEVPKTADPPADVVKDESKDAVTVTEVVQTKAVDTAADEKVTAKKDDTPHTIAEVAASIVKQAEHVVEVAEAAVHEELVKAEHILLTEAQKATTALQKKLDDASAKEQAAIDELNKELVAFEDKAKEVSAATKNKVVKKARAEAEALVEELDHTILADIKVLRHKRRLQCLKRWGGWQELDAESLRLRVAQLATEMKNRSKWEAVRLMESLRRMEEEVHAQLITRNARHELEGLRAQHEAELKALVDAEKTVVQAAFDQKLAALQAEADKKLHDTIVEKTQAIQAAAEHEQADRIHALEDIRVQVKAVNELLGATSNYEAFSHKVHKVSVAALALTNRIEAAAPLHSEINALRAAGKGDELIEATVKTLAKFGDGAPSVAQLQDRFKVVQKAARKAALVPESSQGGMVGHLFANALYFLLIPPGGPIQGNDAEAIISRAEYALRAGDIEAAVVEVDKLSGLPREVVSDWVAAAKSRLAVEQTAKVVKAHISLLAASLS
ncbi:hypothetical protein DYB32_004691 [Aphanomyces invadans]|uniref:Mitofilin n=1 Tax=Aphanomyces invadans TaxID=157072 RepID=A0A418AWS9_9STRA|nr:hypothetical protein DYB32_004691 [Aphanomyces invadans]